MKTHRSEPTRCPYCAKTLDAHSSEDTDEAPQPGDIGVCWGCGQPFKFTAVGLRRIGVHERGGLGENIRRIMRVISERRR